MRRRTPARPAWRKTMSDSDKSLLVGFIGGILCVVVIWLVAASLVEQAKISGGYLTYRNTVYSVTLYDTLDTPEDKDNE